jgi:hypothetical protein
MGGMISFAANATGRREAIIRLNGTTNLLSVRQQTLADAVAYRLAIPPVLYQATAGDYVELMALQSSGGDLDSQVVAEAPAFWVTRVA